MNELKKFTKQELILKLLEQAQEIDTLYEIRRTERRIVFFVLVANLVVLILMIFTTLK